MPKSINKVLVISQHYRPEPNFITADVAEALGKKTEVMVITAHPNYPYGKFYKGTKFWRPVRTVEQGVTIWRLPFFPDHGTSKIQRILSYVSFTLFALLWAPLVAGRPQVVWIYQTPFSVGLSGLYFKYIYRAKLYFTCADLWPESMMAVGVLKGGLLIDLLMKYSRFINRRADKIYCSTKGMLNRFRQDGVPPERLKFIPVWVDGIRNLEEDLQWKSSAEKVIVYAGNMGTAQHLQTCIQAALQLQSLDPSIKLHFYGTGTEEETLRKLAASLKLENVKFLGRVSPDEAYAASSRAFAQIVCLKPTPFFSMTIPSKLFFCFSAGTPILCGLEGESMELAKESGGAFAFDPLNPDSFTKAVEKMLALSPSQHDGIRKQVSRFYRENFDKNILIQKYLDSILEEDSQVFTAQLGVR